VGGGGQREEELMRAIANYFKAGSVYLNRNTFVFRVVNFSEITDIILPLFINHPIRTPLHPAGRFHQPAAGGVWGGLGVKYFDYLDFVRAVKIIKDKHHLTLEGLEQIQKIKDGMNSRRDLI